MTLKNFIREKKIFCGDKYLEVDIYPYTNNQKTKVKGRRNKNRKISAPKQKALNDKNATRYLIQLVNSNFGKGDLKVSLTYTNEELPLTTEDGMKEVRNFMRRVNYRRGKEGLSPLKYIVITEGTTERGGDGLIRLHHHIFMNKGLDRDTVESLWCRKRKKGEKEGKRIGWANAVTLQPDNYGLEAIARYLSKDPQGKKRWTSSQNLTKPYRRDNDNKYRSKRKFVDAIKNDDKAYWERQYPKYWLTQSKAVYNDLTGWSMYLKLRKRE